MAKNMEIGPKLIAGTEQRQIMTQAMQQSLEILQLPQLELGALIQEEIEKNPVLELDSSPFSKRATSKGSTFPDTEALPSLYMHLLTQAKNTFELSSDLEIAEKLIGQLDDRGILAEAIEPQDESILSVLQTFDPPGIFARSCQETFLIQLERIDLKETLAYRLIHLCYDDLLHGRYGKMEKALRCSRDELTTAIKKLAKLSTRPAAQFETVFVKPIYPDLRLVKKGKTWLITSLEEGLPTFHLRDEYLHLQGLPKDQKETMKGFVASGKWLQKSIERRRELLLSVAAHLAKHQTAYLDSKGPLAPMCPAELASVFGVHESTISRALADKYIESPRGLILLKSLISTYSNQSAKEILQQLILKENKKEPLTDDQIAEALKKSGHAVARRTVAKYRTQLNISPATTRKHC